MRASCRPMASAIRRMRGSRGSPLGEPLSLVGQGPRRSSSSAMPTLPRQGPSDENSEETRSESRKFRPSTCGVEMPAGGEALLPYLHGTPLPGRCQPVKAASRRSWARVQHEPLQDGAGPAPWRQAGGDAGHRHSPGPRFVAKPHSTPPALRMMHSTRPARRSTSSWRTWERT